MDVRGVRVKAFQQQELRASLFSLATVDLETQDRPAFAFVSSSSPFQAQPKLHFTPRSKHLCKEANE